MLWGLGLGPEVWGDVRLSQECLLCNQRFCSEHAQPFDFPAGALPDNISRAYVCAACRPQAEHIAADHKDAAMMRNSPFS